MKPRSALSLLRVFDDVREDTEQLGCLFPELEVSPAIPEEEARVPASFQARTS